MKGDAGDFIWANADFNVLGLGSAEALGEHTAASLARTYNLMLTRHVTTKLSGLDAREISLENVSGSGDVNYIRFVVALRSVPNEVGIAYVVGVRGKTNSVTAAQVFSSVVESFRTEIVN